MALNSGLSMQLWQDPPPDYHTADSCCQLLEHDDVLAHLEVSGHTKKCTLHEKTLLLESLCCRQISSPSRQNLGDVMA